MGELLGLAVAVLLIVCAPPWRERGGQQKAPGARPFRVDRVDEVPPPRPRPRGGHGYHTTDPLD